MDSSLKSERWRLTMISLSATHHVIFGVVRRWQQRFYYCPKKQEREGDIQIDGQMRATVSLSTTGVRQNQQMVYEGTGLTSDKHTIKIVNRGSGPVSIDAIIVRERNMEN
jgi:hypothetical protein